MAEWVEKYDKNEGKRILSFLVKIVFSRERKWSSVERK
jgi:hypothetical protein